MPTLAWLAAGQQDLQLQDDSGAEHEVAGPDLQQLGLPDVHLQPRWRLLE